MLYNPRKRCVAGCAMARVGGLGGFVFLDCLWCEINFFFHIGNGRRAEKKEINRAANMNEYARKNL